MASEYLKKLEEQSNFHQNWHNKKKAITDEVFNSMTAEAHEDFRTLEEFEKTYNSLFREKTKNESEKKFDSLEKKQENEFDSFEKWKEDMNRNLQQMEASLKIKRELEEERDGKYSINNNDKIENEFDLLEKEQENELDYKILEDMKRDLQQRLEREKIEIEFKEKIERERIERDEREKRESKKNILKNFRELLKNSNDNNYSSDRPGRIK